MVVDTPSQIAAALTASLGAGRAGKIVVKH